jgi:hypothetical protein
MNCGQFKLPRKVCSSSVNKLTIVGLIRPNQAAAVALVFLYQHPGHTIKCSHGSFYGAINGCGAVMSGLGLGRVKTKSDLIVMPSGRQIFAFFCSAALLSASPQLAEPIRAAKGFRVVPKH